MSEESKQPMEEQKPEAEEAREEKTPEEAAAQTSGDTGEHAGEEKAPKSKKKKEKGITFTREQVEKMELAAKQLESVKDQFTRLSAEYDNYRKRTAREKDSLYQDAKADTIKEFLAVYDNLERAAAAGGEDSPHKKGLEMIFAQYKDILTRLGVEEIPAQGQTFDPELHNAVMHIEDESYGENQISQVFQAGFTLGGKVIRHAIVQVAN